MRRKDTEDVLPSRIRGAFRGTWAILAKGGWCDALDSAEYRRVSAAWVDAGCPLPVSAFVRREANRPYTPEGGGA